MPRDDNPDDERKMTRLVVAALAMSGMCSGTEGRGIASARLGMLVHDSILAADMLIEKLEDPSASEKHEREVYQARRIRFGEAFFVELSKMPGTKLETDLREAWKRACKQVEPEFFPELRT